ncbi:unnamed protein product [Tetraodon nigroviridis]|uniref:(spotted green pufferfish) hypothetical protein n=1 Tax=Tetraodon nigroviridis TaxID=99883 RepID=Q4S368_TETNG|nr:unnamed protein product [Tetraodon nigroviridis]
MAADASTAADSATGVWTVQTSRMNWTVQTQTLLLDGDSVRNPLQRFPPHLTPATRTRFFQTRCPAPPSAAMVTAPVSPREPAWAVQKLPVCRLL